MTILAGDLWAYARRSAQDWSGTQADQEIKDAVGDALEDLARRRQWPYLTRTTNLVLSAPYQTGTLGFTSGDETVTLTGGILPAWTAQGRLIIEGELYEIASRTDDTHLELEIPWPTTESGVVYKLIRDQYPLPPKCAQILDLFPGLNWGWGIDPIDASTVIAHQQSVDLGEQTPSLWAIEHGRILVYPYPTSVSVARIRYYALIGRPTDETEEVDWDETQMAVLHAAIVYQVAMRTGRAPMGPLPIVQAHYERMLANASPAGVGRRIVGPLEAGAGLGPRHPLRPFWNAS